jgi:hypothetical protein
MPGAVLPLQIFEPRYVVLLRDLLEAQAERPPIFGVIAIREGCEVGVDAVRALHPIGCAALLTQAAMLGGQRYLIVTEGQDRFRLDRIDAASTEPYAVADVTWLGEPDGDVHAVADLDDRLRTELAAFRASPDAATPHTERQPPDGPRELSYWLPEAMTLELGDRQRLLECVDTESRLRLGLQLVQRERALARSLGAIQLPSAPPLDLN